VHGKNNNTVTVSFARDFFPFQRLSDAHDTHRHIASKKWAQI